MSFMCLGPCLRAAPCSSLLAQPCTPPLSVCNIPCTPPPAHLSVHSCAKLCPRTQALQEEGKPKNGGGSKAAAPRLPPAKGERTGSVRPCSRGPQADSLLAMGTCRGRCSQRWRLAGPRGCAALTQLGQPARARPRPADVPRSPAGSTSPARRPPASRRRGGHEPAATEPGFNPIPRARHGRASVSPPAAASFPRGFPPPRGR